MSRERANRDQAHVEDILEASSKIAAYTANKSIEDFLASPLLIDAIIRRLAVVGEAAAKLTKTYKETHPKADWRDIVALRNLLVHAYWRIAPEKLWEIATGDVPALASYLREES